VAAAAEVAIAVADTVIVHHIIHAAGQLP